MSKNNIFFWSALNRFSTQAISFIGNILIARQLSPDDYGLVAMLAIIIGIAWNFTDSGFADCLITRQNADKKDFGTIFSYNVFVSILLFIIIYITAPYFAIFFEREELINIARILGLSVVIKAISITEFTRLSKELKFKTLAIIHIISNIVAVVIAYYLALNGYGYWALVVQTLVIGIVDILLIMILTKWKPYFYFSIRRFKEMSGFSYNLLLAYLSNQAGLNLYSFFIGKFHSAFSLGFYRQAQKLKDAPVMGLNAIILTTTYPLLAKETNEYKRYQMYISLLKKFLFLQFIMCSFLLISAYPLIEILYGEKWINSAPFFQLMLIAFLFYPLTTLNINIAKVYGKGKLYRNLTFLKNGLQLVALSVTMTYSITAILYGQIIARYISVLVNILSCGPIINFNFKKQIKIVFEQIWKPSIAMVFSYLVSINFENSYIVLLTIIVVYSFVFISINEYTKDSTYNEFKIIISAKLKTIFRR